MYYYLLWPHPLILLQQNQEIEVDITTTVVEEIALTEEVSFIHKKAVFFINANGGLKKRVNPFYICLTNC